MVGLLDRRLVFVTGKGGVGKTTVAAALALFASEHGTPHPAVRGRRQGRRGLVPRVGSHRFHRPRGSPRPVGHVDGHRGVAARVPPAQPAHPRGRPDRSLGQGLRLRGHRRPRCPRDPHGGQALLRGPRTALRPGGGGRPGHRPHRRPAGRPPGHQRIGEGRAHPVADRLDARHPLRPGPDGGGHRDHPRGDAGQRDDGTGRPHQAGDHRRVGRRHREPGAARIVRPERGRGLRPPVPPRRLGRAGPPGR